MVVCFKIVNYDSNIKGLTTPTIVIAEANRLFYDEIDSTACIEIPGTVTYVRPMSQFTWEGLVEKLIRCTAQGEHILDLRNILPFTEYVDEDTECNEEWEEYNRCMDLLRSTIF